MIDASRGDQGGDAVDALHPLLAKYDRPGPRYTSYPTAAEFHGGIGASDRAAALGLLEAGEPVLLYVHIPFCERRCAYCGCHVIPTHRRAIASTYLRYLTREIDLVSDALRGPTPIRSIHLGGGTPTYLTAAQLEELFRRLRTAFEVEPGAEISVEIDPRVTTEAHLEALRRCEVNRLSFGVQDTSAEVQAAIGRFQDWDETVKLHDLCRSMGFEALNMDLVYGLPCQTIDRFVETVRAVVAVRPDRVAAFGYAHLPGKLANQRAIDEATLPDARERLAQVDRAHVGFTGAGYAHLGLDHFALPDDALAKAHARGEMGRSFMGYVPYRGRKLLGFGVSAISDLPGGYFQAPRKLPDYFDRLDAADLPVERGFLLTRDDRLRRSVIEEVLCDLRVDLAAFDREAHVPFRLYFAREMDDLLELENDGLVEVKDDGLRVTPIGRPLLRSIAMVFDPRTRAAGGAPRVFSRTL